MNSLKSLSDRALVQQLHHFVRKEKHLTLEVLSHLAEVARRELYLAKGYSTLSDYCVSELGYGESSAWRRVRAARVIKTIPQVFDLMKSGRLTLSAVLQVANVLNEKNQAELLPRLVDKSKSEIERIVAEYQLPVPIRDQAKPRIVKKEITVDAAPAGARAMSAGGRREQVQLGEISLRSEGKNNPTVETLGPDATMSGVRNSTPKKIVYEKMYEVRFAGDEELMELMNWLRSHLSHRFPKGATFQEIFKYAMRYVREREDMTKRAERRKQKRKPKPSHRTRERGGTPSRHIAVTEKKKVWVRDGGKCAYTGPSGRRCNSTRNLQYDHYPIPFARGGPNTAENLRLLCARHNRLSAEQFYGEHHMGNFRRRE